MRWVLIGGFSFLLGGCISPEGIAPHAHLTPLSELSLAAPLTTATAAAKPAGAWWQDWHDPALNQLIHDALAHNPSLAQARARLAEAMGQAQVAGAPLAPQAEASLQTGLAHWSENQFFPPPFGGSTTWNNGLNFSLRYSLDLWGKNRAQAQGAIDQTRVAANQADAAALALSQAVAHEYLRLVAIRATLALEQTRAGIAQQITAIERARLARGLSNDDALLAAEQAEQAIQARLVQGRTEANLAEQRLAVLTGVGTALRQPLPEHTALLRTPWAMPASVPAAWVAARPDVTARRWQVAAAAEGITVARAGFYPNIDLTAYLGGLAASNSFLAFLQPGSINLGITPALTLPLFDGGVLRGTLAARSAAYDAAVADYNDSLLTALAQTSAALTALKHGAEQHALAEHTETLAERALAQAQARYRAGLSNALPVLAAEDHLAAVQQTALAVNTHGLDALVALYTAVGGALPTDAGATP